MKDYELLDAIGGIDSKFVEKTEKQTAHFRWQYVAAAAACLVLIAGVYFAYPKLTPKTDTIAETEGVETVEQTVIEETVAENTAIIPSVEQTEPETEKTAIETDPSVENPDIGMPDIIDIIQEVPDSNGPLNQEILNGKPMISGLGNSKPNEDITVDNGAVLLSASLEDAMEYYEDDVYYRVMVKFFRGGTHIIPGQDFLTSLETTRLDDEGYIVALETVTEEVDNGLYVTTNVKYYFTLHATYDQLIHFKPASDFGYFISLYDENFEHSNNSDIPTYNGGMDVG